MIERKTVSQCPTSDYCRGWNDAVGAMPKWISVEEMLPEDDAYYLVYLKGYCENRVARYDGDGEWADQFDDHDITRFVTHWMPLPEPPKEDEK